MSRRAFHRPARAEVIETVALVRLSPRKGILFSIVAENGRRLGELMHVSLTPAGEPVPARHPQRLLMAERVAARFVEAAAGVNVKLREGRS